MHTGWESDISILFNTFSGEIYLAFFNLNNQVTEMSAKISDITKAIQATSSKCTGREVWSGTNLGAINDSISMSIKAHGCALFVLNCK